MKIEKLIQRINQLIQNINDGNDVTNSSLARVLSEKQYLDMLSESDAEKGDRRISKPKALKEYEAKLKVGLLHSSKMDRYHAAGKGHLAKEFSLKADHAFEAALNFLEESMQNDPDIQMWIDRELSEASCDPIGIPRVIGSESFECLKKEKSPYPTRSKRDIKLAALENALAAFESPNLEAICEPVKNVHFGKKSKIDTSGFKF